MAANIYVRNPKALTEEEMEQFLNLGLDDVEFELVSEDSDCEPEIINREDDIVTMESVEPGSSAFETGDAPDADLEGDNLCYQTKVNVAWNKLPFRATRRKNQNIIRKKPGLNQYSCNISSELEAFQLFLTDEILDLIVLHTNSKADQVKNIVLPYLFYVFMYFCLSRYIQFGIKKIQTKKQKHGNQQIEWKLRLILVYL